MEQWLPLFNFLLSTPSPNAAAFSSSSHHPNSTPAAAAFLRLLLSPIPTLPPSDPPAFFFQTLPPFLQSQALYFLYSSLPLLDPLLLSSLATRIHFASTSGHCDFWVRRGARHLLDALSKKGVPDRPEEVFLDEFQALPQWLQEAAMQAPPLLPWLPLDYRSMPRSGVCGGEDGLGRFEWDSLVLEQDEDLGIPEAELVPSPSAPPLQDSVVQRALALQKEIVMVESVVRAQQVAKDLQELCVESRNAEAVLILVQPWEADDDTTRSLLANLVLGEDGVHKKGPALVLCSVVLPKLLELQRQASSVLLSAVLDFCKSHPAATVEALLFPLALRKEGLSAPQCDVLTRIVKDCMHPLHVTAFCHRLLSGEDKERKPVCMPQHRENVGGDLVWTESLFALFYSILNQDICLTPSTSGKLVSVIDEMASKFSRSLKFGNFLLCFLSKCVQESKSHKVLLQRAAERTNTFLTKAILAKLQPVN